MKSKIQLIAVSLAVVVLSALATVRVAAQHSHERGGSTEWKKGMVRLNTTVWLGNVRLKSGMYHVKHVMEGDKHVLVFKEVTLRAGYQGGLMWEGKEVVRVECIIEPATKSFRNTKVILSKTSGGTRTIQEIQIAGE